MNLHHEVHEAHEGSDEEFSHHGDTEGTEFGEEFCTTKCTKGTKVPMKSLLTTDQP